MEKNIETTKPIGFHLKSIELLDSSMIQPGKPLPENTVFNFDISTEHHMNIENSLLYVMCKIRISTKSKRRVLGEIRTSCIFEVKSLMEFFNKSINKLELPENFVLTLNSISISTARGIMFSCFRGTFLHHAVLPIIDPTRLKIRQPNDVEV